MKFADIVTLAKAGYTPKDVKNLLELCETDPTTKSKELPPDVKKTEDETDPKPREPELDAFEKLAKGE